MADRDFDLRILKAGSHYLVDVRSPDGEEANRPFELPISPERLDELFRGLGHPRKATRGGGSPEVRQARDVGRQLFDTVFAGEIRDVFQRSLGRVEARSGDLRIRLRLARDVPELLDLPWELLFDRGRNRFLALEPATTLVRHLPVQQRIEPMRVAPPLHILVAISNPGQAGYPALDVEQGWANLDQALRPLVNRRRVSLTRLDGVTQEALRQALRRDACHVLHYIGHGGYDSAAETGFLVLQEQGGGARPCGASRLTYLLREQPALRLVVLNACEGGRSSRTDPFAGVAQSLVQGAIPAVVAMQFPVTDAAAVVFAKAFYEALASGRPVDLALAEARREVNLRGEEGEIEWATPVLYMRGDGDLFSFEEREAVQPEPTSVAPRTATLAPGTGAAPAAEHGPEPRAEPATTQPEQAGKKPPQEPLAMPWKMGGLIIVLGAVALGFILINTPGQKQETTPAAGPVANTTVPKPVMMQQPKPAGDPLVAKGRELFFNETFDGNGRTCGTCHRAENNLTIDPTFIASLPKDDPLFVAEFNRELDKNFENPKLMRKRGLIPENLDGVDDLAYNTMRGVPHVFSQRFSIDSNPRNRLGCFSDTLCPRTGWSGDGAPETEDLKAFAGGAVKQHFPETTNRKEGIDFRPPTEDEEKALEAFQLSLGRQEELKLPLPLKSAEAVKGQEIFNSTGKCFNCHFNAGANVPPGQPASGNLNFNTGVENLPDPTGDFSQPDDGMGTPGDGTFNTPSLVEAVDTGPFFHNNSVDTIEGAVDFYNSDAFNNSPSGQFLRDGTGRAIALDATQVKAVAAFLRAINALDNIRELNKLLGAVEANVLLAGEHPADVVKRAVNDIDDAIMVLQDGGLHPDAVRQLRKARGRTEKAATSPSSRIQLAKQALDAINQAKSLILG